MGLQLLYLLAEFVRNEFYCTVKPELTTTYPQGPLFWRQIFHILSTKKSLNNEHLSTTATILASRRCLLYSGLIVSKITLQPSRQQQPNKSNNYSVTSKPPICSRALKKKKRRRRESVKLKESVHQDCP